MSSLLLSFGRTMSSGRAIDNRTCVAKMSTTAFCIMNFFRSNRIEHSLTFDCNQKMHLLYYKAGSVWKIPNRISGSYVMFHILT